MKEYLIKLLLIGVFMYQAYTLYDVDKISCDRLDYTISSKCLKHKILDDTLTNYLYS